MPTLEALHARRVQNTIDGLLLERDEAVRQCGDLSDALDLATTQFASSLRRTESDRDSAQRDVIRFLGERNLLVSLVSHYFPSVIGFRRGEGIDAAWRHVVYVDLPTGQVSFHIHESELPLFAHLEHTEDEPWDGHSVEEKRERLIAHAT